MNGFLDRSEAVRRAITRRENPYRTVLADRDIDPPVGRVLTEHLKLGGGVGFLSAGLAACWLCLVGVFTTESSGAVLVVIIAPVAAICGAIVGAVSAVLLGLLLWPTLALRLGRFAYPAAAGLIQGRIMYGWASESFDTGPAATVWVGSTSIAMYTASRWTAGALTQLSRVSDGPVPEPTGRSSARRVDR